MLGNNFTSDDLSNYVCEWDQNLFPRFVESCLEGDQRIWRYSGIKLKMMKDCIRILRCNELVIFLVAMKIEVVVSLILSFGGGEEFLVCFEFISSFWASRSVEEFFD